MCDSNLASPTKMSHKYFIREHKNTSFQSPLEKTGSKKKKQKASKNPKGKQTNKAIKVKETHKRLIHNVSIVMLNSISNKRYGKTVWMKTCGFFSSKNHERALSLTEFRFVKAWLKLNQTLLTIRLTDNDIKGSNSTVAFSLVRSIMV